MIQINEKKVAEKWNPILERMGIADPTRKKWMAEYAEYHQAYENVGYANLGNITGMGAVVSPSVSSIPGQLGYGTGIAGQSFGNGSVIGSGDFGQQLLPVAMKVAAQTIGLDLVAVKPSAGPVIDLMYVDYRYDDGEFASDYNPMLFKLDHSDATVLQNVIDQLDAILVANNVRKSSGGLTDRVFVNLAANTTGNANPNANSQSATRPAGSVTNVLIEPTGSKEGVVEFLGFSRIDGLPMFKSYRTTNVANQGIWRFDNTKNTFGETETVVAGFSIGTATSSGNTVSFGTSGTVRPSLISALEDMIPGFSAPNGLKNPMDRATDDKTYPGIIAPNVTTKRVQVGTIEIGSALKRTEIEDIKSQTGIDITQKIEAVLVNELSQVISKEIVYQIFALGNLNRKSAPGYRASQDNTAHTIFDYDVTARLAAYGSNAGSGETSQSLQNALITKVFNASGFIATEGRVGPATFAVTNHTLAAVLMRGANYQLNPVEFTQNATGQLYPIGKVMGIQIYVDPYMKYDDKRIALGRKNNPDQPGLVFVPYLMAQSISLISEATNSPKITLRSRYALAEVGFFPQKSYMTIYVNDPSSLLS